ncbi:ATP-binding protein [Elizabethkingia anophelis]|nr:ATP-binding protein [Elizabethkingia anophelis]
MKRALTPSNIRNKKRKLYDFADVWLRGFGKIERGTRIIIYGESGNGKTVFVFQFAKYLRKFGRVIYNSLELGDSLALEAILDKAGISNEVIICNRETIEQLSERLRQHKSPEIVIIDSLQYFRDENGNGINYKKYIEFTQEFSNKTLIFISHGKGKNPLGSLAESVKFDADCKVYIKGFKAFVTSRYGGGEPITIWEDGAKEYWGEF